MKPVMALNGILHCSDLQLMCVMNRILDDFAIETKMCASVPATMQAISGKVADCIVLEWTEETPAMIQALRSSPLNRSAFVIAVVGTAIEMKAAFAAGANLAIQKNQTADNVMRAMRAAYGFLIRQRRAAPRVPVWLSTKATVQNCSFPLNIVDISSGGLCLQTATTLQSQDLIRIGIPLPNRTVALTATGKVLWVKGSRAGLKFSFLPRNDQECLAEFLKSQLETPDHSPKTTVPASAGPMRSHARL